MNVLTNYCIHSPGDYQFIVVANYHLKFIKVDVWSQFHNYSGLFEFTEDFK